MKSRYLFVSLLLASVFTLDAQSFQQAFHPHYAMAQHASTVKPNNYGSNTRLSSGVPIGYKEGINLKEEYLLNNTATDNTSLQLTQSKNPMILQAAFEGRNVERYHLILTTKKGAFLENFPLQSLTRIDCRRLRAGSYKIKLCARDQATPLQQFKLVKY